MSTNGTTTNGTTTRTPEETALRAEYATIRRTSGMVASAFDAECAERIRRAGLTPTPQQFVNAARGVVKGRAPASKPAPVSRVEPTIIEAINEQAEQGAAAGRTSILGWTCWWSFSSVEVSVTDFSAMVTAAGLDEQLIPGVNVRGGALAKALTAVHSGFQVVRNADESDETRIVYSLAQKSSDASLVRHDVQKVTYDRASKSLSFATDFLRAEISSAFAKFNTILSSDKVSTFMTDTLSAAKALRVRDNGGVYFLPVSEAETRTRLRDLMSRMQSMGQRVRLTMQSAFDVPSEKLELQQDIGASLIASLDAEVAELDRLLSPEEGKGAVRRTTLEDRVTRFRDLKERALGYRDLIQLNVVDVEAGLEALTKRVEALL